MSKQGFFYNFIKKTKEPPLDRTGSKYYPEMQILAYNLVRYLKMNEDPNEHSCQGNYNLTYLIENMREDDFKYIVNLFMRRIPLGELKEMIKDNFGEDSYSYLYSYLEDVLEVKPKYKVGDRFKRHDGDIVEIMYVAPVIDYTNDFNYYTKVIMDRKDIAFSSYDEEYLDEFTLL